MKDNNILVQSIKERLDEEVRLPYQATDIAYDLFLLMQKKENSSGSQIRELVSVFLHKLYDWGLDDVLKRQVEYAIRIAESDDELEYEEMHKLLSLCDEIYALEYLGLNIEDKIKQYYECAVRNRFHRERKKAKLAAQDKAEEWKKEFWWYKENLK